MLTIGAALHDFFLLTTRKADLDTLLFNRRIGGRQYGTGAGRQKHVDGIDLPKLADFQQDRVLARFEV
jgi:hypothetical protein